MDALQRIMQTTQRAQPQPDLHIHAGHHRQRQTTQHHHQDAVDAGHVLATGLGRAVDMQPVRMARDVEVACQPIQQLVTRPTQGQQLDRTRHRPGHGHIQAAVPQRPGAIHGAFGVQLPVPAREDEAELVADQPVVEAHPSAGVHHQTRHDAVGPFIERTAHAAQDGRMQLIAHQQAAHTGDQQHRQHAQQHQPLCQPDALHAHRPDRLHRTVAHGAGSTDTSSSSPSASSPSGAASTKPRPRTVRIIDTPSLRRMRPISTSSALESGSLSRA